MHYAISTKILGQTHMRNTQNKRSNFLKIFQLFMGFWIFEHTQKQNTKLKSTKKQEQSKNFEKEAWLKHKQMIQTKASM